MGFIYGSVYPTAQWFSPLIYFLGTVTIFQYGAGQAGVVRTLGKYMIASGGMFG
jgi:hypothetical protein